MKMINNNLNEVIINKLTIDDISRCPDCNLICSLQLNYKEQIHFINYECENNHNGTILLKDYLLKYNKFELSKEKCSICNKNKKEIIGDFSYCTKCKQFLCKLCLGNHIKHYMIPYQKYDGLCKIHSETYAFYCIECKKNICNNCILEHQFHNKIDLSTFNYSKKSKNKLKEEIKNIENKINDLNSIKQNIITEIDKINKLMKSSEIEIKFIEILLYSYEFEENQNNLNYYVVQNLNNFRKRFISNKMEIYETIYNKGKKFITILKNLQNIKPNCFKNNFKTLTYHKHWIYHIDKLNDGRLISCSCDKTLNIYKKDSYDIQLSIKEHSNSIFSFTQLCNGSIITCSSDNTMKIIKLTGENKYQIKQTLIGHTNTVYKIIEIKENELISISNIFNYIIFLSKWKKIEN